MAKGVQRTSVVKWFGEQSFEVQDKVLGELSSMFEKGKKGKIVALEAELARLRNGSKPQAAPLKSKPAAVVKSAGKGSALAGRKIEPKYRHPKDPSKTWAGRGVQPTWMREYLKGGGKMASLVIKK